MKEHENSETTLITLPQEILHMITEYLSPIDAASSVFCNRTLFGVLGNEHVLALHSGNDNEVRELLLTTLTRDLPGHFFCHYCSHLHLRDDLGPPGPALQPDKLLLCVKSPPELDLWYCFQAHPLMSRYGLTFPQLQLAMKRHDHGPFTEVQVSDNNDDVERVTTLLSVEARICPQPISLCLQIQQWALLTSTKRDKTLSETRFEMIYDQMHTRSSEISRLIESTLGPNRTEFEC